MELVTGENDSGRRLDRILRKALPDYPLPLIHRLLRKGKVRINGKPAKADTRVGSGVKININISLHNVTSEESAEKISFQKPVKKTTKQTMKQPAPDIIWQGYDLIAVNKPSGLSVHGRNSLDEMVNSYLARHLTPSLSFKPGPLHRLDKPTSGIIIFSTGIEGARLFSSLLREGKVKKTYLAIVEGHIKKEEVWEDILIRDKDKKKTFILADGLSNSKDGKKAVTKIAPVSHSKENNSSLIRAEIKTGRTHQIRAQASHYGHPLLGDVKYGGKKNSCKNCRGFFLHAWKLEFLDVSIEAPIDRNNKLWYI